MSNTIIGAVFAGATADTGLAAQFPGGIFRGIADNKRPTGAFLTLDDEENPDSVYTSTNRIGICAFNVAIYDTTAASVMSLMLTWQDWFNDFQLAFDNIGFLPGAKLIHGYEPPHESTDYSPKGAGTRLHATKVSYKVWISFAVR